MSRTTITTAALTIAVALGLLGSHAPAQAATPLVGDTLTGSHATEAHEDLDLTDGLDRAIDATCGMLTPLTIGDELLCTHGPDTAPARAAGGDRPGKKVPTEPLTCVDGGTTGQRVEVLFVHGPGGSPATSARRSQVQRWVEQVEWTVVRSADRLGGDRRVRWLMPGCELRITSVGVSDRALGDFSTFLEELHDMGLRRRDRTYLTFVDASTYCGIATAPQDDRATRNAAERLAGYARVDRTCWGTGDDGFHSVAAHELFHTLGAVQPSAPNGTPGSHCTDEHDLLCYDDRTGKATRTVCRDKSSSTSGAGDWNDRLLDCRGDDYFHPAPPAGSYLDQHWNTADHARLHDPHAPKQSSSGGGQGSGERPPSPTSNPIGYVFDLVFG